MAGMLFVFRVVHILMSLTILLRLREPTWRAFTKARRKRDFMWALYFGSALAMVLFAAQGIVTHDMPDARTSTGVSILTSLRCAEYAFAITVMGFVHAARGWYGNDDS